jgi:multiple sugar transport system substrate-binding protein
MSKLSRRDFLKLTGTAAGAAAAASTLPFNIRTARAQAALTVQLRSLFTEGSNAVLTSLVQFWAAQNNVTLDLSLLNHNQMAETLATAAATGAGPDVLETVHIKPHQFAESLVDISDVCEPLGEENGGWYDVARDIAMVDGVWRAMPHNVAAHALVVREDIFQEAGIGIGADFPANWDELLVAGTELKRMGKPMGFALGHADGDGNNFCYSVLWSFGASVTDEEGIVNLNTPETRQAVEFVQQLYNDAMDPNVIAWDDASNNLAFSSGEISCTNNASSILYAARRDNKDFKDAINHYAYPAGPAGLIQFLELNTVQILNYSQQVDMAKSLLAYLNSPDLWLPLAPGTIAFTLPLLKAWDNHPAMPWNSDPKLAAFKGLAETGKALGYPAKPSAAASQVASNFLVIDMFAQVCAGAMSIDESIQMTEEACKEIYGQ